MAIAWKLARAGATTDLFERSSDVAAGASKGNAGVLTSFFAPPGTDEARFVAESSRQWKDLCGELGVAYRRCGALVVGRSDPELASLERDLDQAHLAGARAELLDGDTARELEPMLASDVVGALHLPDEAVVDSLGVVVAIAERAVAAGARFHFRTPVVDLAREPGGGWIIATPDASHRARFLVNAAGLGAAAVNRLAGGEQLDVRARRGQYWIIDPSWGAGRLAKIVIPALGPAPGTRGPQIVPTTSGATLLGPTAEDVEDPFDTSTDAWHLEQARRACAAVVPSVASAPPIKFFAASRVAIGEQSAHLRRDPLVPNLFLAANRAIGLSCAPAMSDAMAELLLAAGLEASRASTPWSPVRPGSPVRSDPPDETEILCMCEHVTAGQVDRALRGALPARSIEGVRKRTRATGGRCQGADCLDAVAIRCAQRLAVPLHEVPAVDAGTPLGTGSVA